MAYRCLLAILLTSTFDLDVAVGLAETLPLYIIGGNTTDIKQHPYQVAIWSNDEFRGSGALVGKTWAVTSASIIVGFDPEYLNVRAQSTFASSGGKLYNVRRVLIHPRFCFSNMSYDVALLKLKHPLMLSTAPRRPLMSQDVIPLARHPLPPNTTLVLSGWGSSTTRAQMSDQLLQTDMSVVAKPECQTAYTRQLVYSQFCAIAVDVYGPCWGDSGDLLVNGGRLYGLLSWNKGCYDDKVPSVFTNIPSVYHWVHRTMKRHNKD